jgi:hypothetical protein
MYDVCCRMYADDDNDYDRDNDVDVDASEDDVL